MGVKVSASGDFSKTLRKLTKNKTVNDYMEYRLSEYGYAGVEALRAATPVDTGKTAKSWQYEVIRENETMSLRWYNTNKTENNISIPLLIQYGHATRDGRWIEGNDFINPAMKPIFDGLSHEIWKEVTED